jgi:hypothetical protein
VVLSKFIPLYLLLCHVAKISSFAFFHLPQWFPLNTPLYPTTTIKCHFLSLLFIHYHFSSTKNYSWYKTQDTNSGRGHATITGCESLPPGGGHHRGDRCGLLRTPVATTCRGQGLLRRGYRRSPSMVEYLFPL